MRGFYPGQMEGGPSALQSGWEWGEKTQEGQGQGHHKSALWGLGPRGGELRPQARTDFSFGVQSWPRRSSCSGGSEFPVTDNVHTEAVDFRVP